MFGLEAPSTQCLPAVSFSRTGGHVTKEHKSQHRPHLKQEKRYYELEGTSHFAILHGCGTVSKTHQEAQAECRSVNASLLSYFTKMELATVAEYMESKMFGLPILVFTEGTSTKQVSMSFRKQYNCE